MESISDSLLRISDLLIKSAIGGIVGNRADDLFCRVMQTVGERLQQGGKPVNRDLQKAVRKAYLQATLALMEARLHEQSVNPSVPDIRHLLRLPQEPSQLLRARRAILQELRQLPSAAYIPPSSEAEQRVELLLQPKGVTAHQRVTELKAQLKAQLLQELRDRWGVAPSERVTQMLQQGWQEVERDQTIPLDWFELLCAFFVEELKRNERVANIFQSQLLVNLSVDDVSIDYSAFIQQLERFAGQALAQLHRIEQSLEQLRQENAEAFQTIQERLDEYLPTLLTGMEQMQGVLQALQMEVRRRPLVERYAGLELARRTEKVIRDHTELFVGRESEIEQLDEMFRQPSGVQVITAPAGYGKTALLANWVAMRHANGCFVAYHFFRKEYDDANRLDSIPNALYNLLRQLYIYYGIKRGLPPRDEGQVRDALLGLWQKRGARKEEPLVLLLDGLDEAEKALLPALPYPLREGVYAVVSVRAEEDATPDVMRWFPEAQRLHLQNLSQEAVGDYLARVGDGELASYAQDAEFVEQVTRKTEGYPLHLRLLADDLLQAAKTGGDVRDVLKRTPTGFENYVRAQIRTLAQSLANAPRVQRMFALLATALGALSERDIETLADLTAFELRALPSEATRWLCITERDGERYYALTHPMLGNAFGHALGSLAQTARRQLLNYCACWQEHRSSYALRHYAAHLKEAGKLDALYELARDEAFRHAQRDNLPAEPDLPLRPLQTALDAAIGVENVVVIAEMLLHHAYRAAQAETPLDALRQGKLERAIGLANQVMNRDHPEGTLWLLLLAWNRHHAGDADSAEHCLKEILLWWRGKKSEKLREWHSEAGVFLLAPLGHVPSAPAVAVHILTDDAREKVAIRWAGAGLFEQALKTVQQMEGVIPQFNALVEIAEAMAQAGELEQAKTVFQQALGTTCQLKDATSRSWALARTAQALADTGQFEQAFEIAQQIEDDFHRSEALASTARVMAQAGKVEQAHTVFQQALETAGRIQKVFYRSWKLVEVAEALAQVGEAEQAQTVLQRALETAYQIENAFDRCEALARTAQVMAKAGRFEQALETARQTEDEFHRSRALAEIAQVMVQAGQPDRAQIVFQQAIKTAQQVEDGYNRSAALAEIARVMVQVGQLDGAQIVFQRAVKTAQRLKDEFYRSEALAEIARVMVQVGQPDGAQAVLQQALETAQQIEDEADRSEVLVGIAQAMAQTDQTEMAQDVFQQVLESAQQSGDVYNRSWALQEIARALAQAGEVEQAQTVFQQALKIAKQTESAEDSSKALQDLAQAMAQAGRFEQALETAQQIADALDRCEALARTAQVMAQLGQRDKMHTVLQQALKIARRMRYGHGRSKALQELSQALAQAGQFEQAIEAAEKMEWEFEISAALAGVAKMLTHAGQVDKAQTVFQRALQTVWLSEYLYYLYPYEALQEVPHAMAKVRHFDQAVETAQQLEDGFYRAGALAQIAQVMVQVEQRDRAQTVLQQAVETAQQLKDGFYRAGALAQIAQVMVQVEQRDRAQTVLQQAVETAQQLQDGFYRAGALAEIAQVMVQVGQVDKAQTVFQQALETAHQIKQEQSRSKVLVEIAQVMTQAGQVDKAQTVFQQALETAHQIKGAQSRSKVLVEIAQAMTQAGQREWARDALQRAWTAARAPRDLSVLWEVAEHAAKAGFDNLAVEYAQHIAGDRINGLPKVLNALTERQAKQAVLQLLPLCGWAPETALYACSCLIRLYPGQASAVADAVLKSDWTPGAESV